MSVESDHRPFEDELAAYVLDALAAEERRAFELHLETCGRCRAQERWLRVAVDVLPSSVEQVEPPSQLKGRLMDAVRADANAEARAKRSPRRAFRLRLALRPAVAAGAAAVVLAAAAGGYLIGNTGGGSATKTVAFQPTGVVHGAKAEIVRTGDAAVVRVDRLPPPRPGHVYQLWLVRGNSPQPKPSSVFVVARDGRGAAAIPGGLDGARQVLVSVEPRGGSKSPTSKPVLRATL